MPWPKSTVPKFGNWEKSEDLSYSIIFDKARAEKERFLHISEGDPKDILSEKSFYKNSNVEAGKKTPDSVIPDKAGADRERFLPTPQQDKRYTHLHQNVVQNPEITAGRGASHVSYDKLRTRISGYSGPKSPSGVRILQEQQNSSNIQPDHWNQSDVPAYNSPFPSGAPSRQPLQSGATKETTFFNDRQHVNQEDIGYQGRLHAKSTNTPGRYTYEESGPKSPSGVRILQEQQNSSNIQPDPWNQSDVPAHSSPFPSGAPSKQLLQSGATKETTFFNERQHVNQEAIGYQGRLHAKSTNTPGRYMYEENPAIAKIRSSQRGLEVSRTADMQRKHVVPKFGDWDSGERFTAVFNKVRIEKSSKYSLNPSAKAVSPLRPDEDLYKTSGASEGSAERKKRRGWLRIICCSEPYPHSANL